MSLATFLATEPRPAEAQQLEQVAGGIGRALAAAGIANSGKLDDAAGLVVEALAQQRVYELAVRLPGVTPDMPSDTAYLLLRYRVEAQENLDLQRKLQLLAELAASDATYPASYTRAALLARAQRCDLAAPVFDEAAARGENARQARVNAAWCRER